MPSDFAIRAQDAFSRRAGRYGSTVKTPQGNVMGFLTARERDTSRDLGGQANGTERRPFILYLTGDQFAVLNPGDTVIVGGENYVIDTLHPELLQDVCVYVAATCLKE